MRESKFGFSSLSCLPTLSACFIDSATKFVGDLGGDKTTYLRDDMST
jgi:hypothetical protein